MIPLLCQASRSHSCSGMAPRSLTEHPELHDELERLALRNHGKQSGVLFAVKGCCGRRAGIATHRLFLSGRVEPEANIKGMNGAEGRSRIFDEGLFIEDALHFDRGNAIIVALDIGLVPARAEPAEGSTIERRILDQEHVEACI